MPGLNFSRFKFRREILVNPRGSPKLPPWLASSNVPNRYSTQRKALPGWYCTGLPAEKCPGIMEPIQICILPAARAFLNGGRRLYLPVGSSHSPSPFFLQLSSPWGTYNNGPCMPAGSDAPIPPVSIPRNVF